MAQSEYKGALGTGLDSRVGLARNAAPRQTTRGRAFASIVS